MSLSKKSFITLLLMIVHLLDMDAQSFRLFSPEVKTDYPSVVYDFLERYLFELDSLERKGVQTRQRIDDDKVVFIKGSALTANEITTDMIFTMNIAEGKSYRVCWSDTTGHTILELAFPMSYELILGKPKHIIETELKHAILNAPDYNWKEIDTLCLLKSTDDCYTQDFIENYYIESLSTATYYSKDSLGVFYPTFDNRDKWHSAANLFMGAIQYCSDYSLLVKQNLYGFQKDTYRVPLGKWLGYCQSMKMTTFFAVEEEREDGIKALIIAQSQDLGFNHVLSVIIPEDFISSKNCVLKATVNAYVPTQNVKDLYQQYVDKPKKKYE